MFRTALAKINGLTLKFLVFLVKLYKFFVSPLLGSCCRYYPSCSSYSIEALKKFGVFKGGWLTIKRLLKCNPFFEGGFDYLQEK